MIKLINELRDKYITPIDGLRGITVDNLSELSRANSYDWQKIPMADCILTQMSEDGTITNFSVRPEVMKIIMYRENGKNISFISKVIKNVNFLNRIFFRYDQEYMLKIRGEKEVSLRDLSVDELSSALSSPKLKDSQDLRVSK